MSSTTSSTRKRSRGTAPDVDDDDTSPPSAPPPAKRVTRSTTRSTDAQPSDPLPDHAQPSDPLPDNTQPSDPLPDNAHSSQANRWSTPYDFEDTIMQSGFLERVKSVHEEFTVPFDRWMLEMLSLGIRESRPDRIKRSVELIDQWFALYPQTDSFFEKEAVAIVQETWEELRAEIYKPQAPSIFCKSSNWARQQHGPAFINCLRPAERSGLPLNLLHPLFAQFSALMEEPPDYTNSKFILAERVATNLCQEMPEPFASEAARLGTFQRIVSPLFEEVGVLDEVKIGSGKAGLGIRKFGDGLILVGKGRNEPGGGAGDPYMQVAASYDAWARCQDNSDTGCPCFVLCIDGPNILFGGGFRDNEVSVVEPLSGWCVMMPHGQLQRERSLARHLYSLQCCLSDRSQFLNPLPSRAVCCPRIYNAFDPIGPEESEPVPLKFIKPFKNPWQRQRGVYDLLFRALVKEEGSESTVLVKVPLDSTYGSDAHVLAASAGFAPRLLGKTGVAGAPTIYVMDLLRKDDGWFHLVDFELPTHMTEEQKVSLRRRGEELIDFLSSNQLVHGDLRGCNIMCRLDGNGVHLRVLDWDWAGKQGTARYPATLNVQLSYQGKPGGLIDAPHDKYMLEKTLMPFSR